MGSKWDIEKFSGSNDFVWNVKMQAVLTQQKCIGALKGEVVISSNLKQVDRL